MKIKTRYFGEIDLDDSKIVHFENGLFGFEEYKDYTILYDSEGEEEPFFSNQELFSCAPFILC